MSTWYCGIHDLFDCWFCPEPRPYVTRVDMQEVSTVRVPDGFFETVIFYNDDTTEARGRQRTLEAALRVHDEAVEELRQDGIDTLRQS